MKVWPSVEGAGNRSSPSFWLGSKCGLVAYYIRRMAGQLL